MQNYDLLRERIRSSYRLLPENYRTNFREAVKQYTETFHEFAGTLGLALDRWMESCSVTTFEKLRELILVEHFISTLTPQIKMFVLDKNVKTIAAAAEAADLYVLNHAFINFHFITLLSPNRRNFKSYSNMQTIKPSQAFQQFSPQTRNKFQPQTKS
jgi:hypothetical protein